MRLKHEKDKEKEERAFEDENRKEIILLWIWAGFLLN
jgi:hypothetical protein